MESLRRISVQLGLKKIVEIKAQLYSSRIPVAKQRFVNINRSFTFWSPQDLTFLSISENERASRVRLAEQLWGSKSLSLSFLREAG